MNFFEASVKTALGAQPRAVVYLAAVSGGADSTAMLAALTALRGEIGFALHVLHVEHGIRPAEESLQDALFVKNLCKEFDVSCNVISIPHGRIAQKAAEWGIGTEAAARVHRHRALKQEAKRIGAERILLAHTKDDVLETILMRIMRGSGPTGLARMPMERGLILRPLLELTRADVLAYLDSRGISFQTDSTNADIHFLRNRIRHKLIPCLDDFFPSWRQSLLNFAETQRNVASFLSNEAEKRIPWNIGEGGVWEKADVFMAEPLIIKEEAVFLAANMLTKSEAIQPLKRKTLRNLLKHFENGTTASGDLGPVRLEMRDKKVHVTRAGTELESGFSMLIDEPGIYKIKGLAINVESASDGGIHDVSVSLKCNSPSVPSPHSSFLIDSFPLVLRPWKKKDFIIKTGHKRHLSDTLDRDTRTGYTGFITAEDPSGIAAVIGIGPQQSEGTVLLKRD